MKKGELWNLNFPSIGGREQSGIRPCIIIADTVIDLVIVVPLTSNVYSLNLPNTFEIKKSNKNNLEKDSFALVFQIQSLDKKRLISKIGELEENLIKQLNISMKELLKV